MLFASDHTGATPATGAEYQVAQTADADHMLFDVAAGTYSVTATASAGGKLTVARDPGGSLAPRPGHPRLHREPAGAVAAIKAPAPTEPASGDTSAVVISQQAKRAVAATKN